MSRHFWASADQCDANGVVCDGDGGGVADGSHLGHPVDRLELVGRGSSLLGFDTLEEGCLPWTHVLRPGGGPDLQLLCKVEDLVA